MGQLKQDKKIEGYTRFENLKDKDGNTLETIDPYGYLRNIESLRKISELASNSGKRLKKIFNNDTIEKLNDKAIENAIAKGKAKELKFNDSTKK